MYIVVIINKTVNIKIEDDNLIDELIIGFNLELFSVEFVSIQGIAVEFVGLGSVGSV